MAIIIRLSGNNVINATTAADQITTGAGNDTINAGEGANTIDAGAGNNVLTAGSGDDTITSGAGNDVINAGAGHNRIRAGDGLNVITTGNGNDSITTGAGNDTINAGDGLNTIDAGAGVNVVTSGSGNDDITTGAGNDVINAGAGNNTVNAGDGANVITAGSGNDTITSGSGNDVINAGDGNNTIGAGVGNNVITTGSGTDSITTGSGNDTINAGNGTNTVTSGAGNDVITTGSGADLIDAGGNNDVVNSGTGNDVIVHRLAENAGSLDQYDGSSGQDTLRLDLSSAEWARADVQADVAAFLARANPAAFFRFSSTNLTVVNIERLEVFVEGVQLANPANEAVSAVADSINATEDTPTASANLLLNDSVPDRAASVTLLGSSTLGTVSLASSLGGAVQTATLSFVPNPSLQSLAQGQSVSETLQYRVQDVNGDFSIASVTITVTGVNDAASISGDANGAVSEDSTTLASGQLNVIDVDTGENALQPVAAGTLGDNGYGSFEVLANGQWTYTLNNSLPAVQALGVGATLSDSIVVLSQDGTANQTLEITLTGTNDTPVAQAAVNAVDEDATIIGNVSATDADAGETATLTYALVNPAPAGLTFNADGSYSFDASSYDSLTDGEQLVLTIPITASDVNSATSASASANLVITITGTNDAPTLQAVFGIGYIDTAADDSFSAASGTLLGQDADSGATLSYGIDGGTVGSYTVGADSFDVARTGSYGTLYVNASTGAYRFVPADSAIEALKNSANEIFQFTVSDGIAVPTQQPLLVVLNGANDTPEISLAGPISLSTNEDTSVGGSLTVTDLDAGDTVDYIVSGLASNGTATANADGSFNYQPNANFFGTDSFTLQATDGSGAADTVVVNVAVASVADTDTLTQNTGLSSTVLTPGGNLLVGTGITGQSGFHVATDAADAPGVEIGLKAIVRFGGTYSLDPADTTGRTYLVDSGRVDQGPAGFNQATPADDGWARWNYLVSLGADTDSNGGSLRDQVYTFAITKLDGGGSPTTPAITFTLTQYLAGAVLANAITQAQADAILDGKVFQDSVNLEFVPGIQENFDPRETGSFRISVTATDSQGVQSLSNSIVVKIVNSAPVATDDSFTTNEDTAINFTASQLLGNDTDANAQALRIVSVGNAANGSVVLNLDGTVTFTPAANYNGPATFDYVVGDGQVPELTDTGSVSINVNAVNDAPTLQAVAGISYTDTAADDSFTAASGTLVGQDIDSGTTLSYSIAGGTAGSYTVGADSFDVAQASSYGTLYVNASTGAYRFVPDDSAIEALTTPTTETFQLTVSDGFAAPTPQALVVTLSGANDTPEYELSGPFALVTNEDTSVGGTFTATDRDAGDTVTYSVSSAASNGTATANADGSYSYQPNANYFGSDSFTLKATDSSGAADTVVVNVAVASVNDPASISGTATGAVSEDGTLQASGQLSVSDPDAGEAELQAIAAGTAGASGYGSFEVKADGSWTYTLDNASAQVQALNTGDTKTDSITVVSKDGTASQTITVTVAGQNEPRTVIDLSTLSAAQGFVMQGYDFADQTGGSVSSAGDVNGDGFDDLIVGTSGGDLGGINAGEAYVVFGGSVGFGTADTAGRQVIDLSSLDAAQGFIIQGDAEFDSAGFSVSSAGDVNGDGFDDLIVGARLGDDGGGAAGEAYVVFGGSGAFGTAVGAGRRVIDLSSLGAGQGFIIQGDVGGDFAGWSVSSAGDVNGDGFDDLIVGALGGSDGGSFAGEAYVVFGGSSGFGAADSAGRRVIDLSSLGAVQGFIIQGDVDFDLAGESVSSAADVNGDGFDDLIVGAAAGDDGGGNAGEAYVVFGGSGGFGTVGSDGRQVIDLTSLGAVQGFIIQGDVEGDEAGRSVASSGDINGDGFADLIVGALRGDDGGDSAGEAYVVFGGAGGFGTADATGRRVIYLSTLGATQGFVIQGDEGGNFAGISVSSAGDINGDGFDDLIVGANGAGGSNGEAYVVFGGSGGFGTVDPATMRRVIDLSSLDATQGFILLGDQPGDGLGSSVSSAGDVNGDGFDDLIVGAPFGSGPGKAYLVYGAAFSASDIPVLTTGSAAAEILIGGRGNDQLAGGGGADVLRAGAGNDSLSVPDTAARRIDGGLGQDTLAFTGAGLSIDLSAGAAGLLGSRISGIETLDITGAGNNALTLDASFLLDTQSSGNTAFTAAASRNNLVVLGNAGDTLTLETSGAVAGAKWSQVGDNLSLSGTAGGGYDLYQLSTASGGAVAVVAVVAVSDTVRVFGSNDPAPVIDLSTLSAAQGFVVQGDAGGDLAGISVSSAGDVNGDGFDDLIVGARLGDDGGGDAGEAYVVFGGAGGLGTADGAGRLVIDLTNLSAAQGFIIQGDVRDDRTGWSVSSAGDVNGDGFGDLIVGAPEGDDGGSFAGEGYVVFGGPGGLGTADGTGRRVIDLTSLGAAQGFVIQGDAGNDFSGRSVSSAGDVNGDGFDDLIVGAPGGNDGGGVAGEAYVVFGGSGSFGTADATGRQVIDLTSLGDTKGFIIQGDGGGDQAGNSVSTAGDVNGDGFDDLIVGAWLGDDGGGDAGEAYVVFGGTGSFGAADGAGRRVIDLTTLSAAQGFIIQGDGGGDVAGWSVSSAGDVNGDGFDDLIVGAILGDDGGTEAGEAYVVFGGAAGFGKADSAGRQVIDLTSLSAAQGFIIQGDVGGDQAGYSVSSAGDVNGDGFDDLIVGAVGGDDGGGLAGEAYVVFGGAGGFGTADGTGRQVIDLSGLGAAKGFVIQGDEGGDQAGFSVSSAGDVNGDGFDDLIVGAPGGNGGGGAAGEAYVVFGAAFGVSDTPVLTTGSAAAEILIGGLGNDQLAGGGGADVLRAGAGNDTLSVPDTAARRIDGGLGQDTLVFTGAGLSIDLSAGAAGLLGSRISGIETLDITGAGNNALTLDASFLLDTQSSGNTDFTSTLATSRNNLVVLGNAGDTLTLETSGAVAGAKWSQVGDNLSLSGAAGGGYDLYQLSTASGSAVAVVAVSDTVRVFGSNDPAPVIDLSTLSTAQGFIIQGDTGVDQAGYSVSSAGDVNGDGFDDLIVGARLGDDGGIGAGEAYVVFGGSGGLGTADGAGRQVIDLTNLSAAQGFIIQGDVGSDQAGTSVSSAGDVNGDGVDDLIVGAPLGNDGGISAGEAYVVFGRSGGFGAADATGRRVIDLTSLGASQGFIIQGDVGSDQAGWSVSSAGDVNGDGIDDLIVGAPGGNDGGISAGEAYVVFGGSGGFGTADAFGRQVIDLSSLGAAQGFIIQGDVGGDQAGWSVSSAGDVNGDGFDELIVGARFGDDGGSDAGEAYVVFGGSGGLGTADGTGRRVIDLSSLGAAQGFIIQGDVGGDQAGWSVSSASDVNGDGVDDLIVGAVAGDDGGISAGEAYVVFGGSGGFGAADGTGRRVIDLSSLSASQGFIIQGDVGGDNAGYSVSSAGDVNGDGFKDLIVGAWLGDGGGISAGEAFVVFGGSGGFGTADGAGRRVIDLSSLGASQGFIIQGDADFDNAGISVSSAGDVNGDGYDDLIVGAQGGDDGGGAAGEAYVVFGAAFGASATPVLTTGSAAAEILIGGRGNDQLAGGGGSDVLRAGAGNDSLSVPDTAARRIDGGLGQDTLAFTGSGLSIDLSAGAAGLLGSRISGIETLDITGAGNNALTLDASFLLDTQSSGNTAFTAAASRNNLVVLGNAGDTLTLETSGAVALAEWKLVKNNYSLDDTPGGGFDIYQLGVPGGSAVAVVGVSEDVAVTLI